MADRSIPSPADRDARILFLTREGCHLCEDALPVVRAEADRAGTSVEVVDIDTDATLQRDWDYDVPVIIVDGKVHARYRVDAEQLRTALRRRDRKSTRLNSSHVAISYAVFCLKKKRTKHEKSYLFVERGLW